MQRCFWATSFLVSFTLNTVKFGTKVTLICAFKSLSEQYILDNFFSSLLYFFTQCKFHLKDLRTRLPSRYILLLYVKLLLTVYSHSQYFGWLLLQFLILYTHCEWPSKGLRTQTLICFCLTENFFSSLLYTTFYDLRLKGLRTKLLHWYDKTPFVYANSELCSRAWHR